MWKLTFSRGVRGTSLALAVLLGSAWRAGAQGPGPAPCWSEQVANDWYAKQPWLPVLCKEYMACGNGSHGTLPMFIRHIVAAPQPVEGTPQRGTPQQREAGDALFSAHCGFCHGRDAAGGERGPDLTRSPLVAEDTGGDKIAPVVRNGRVERGMPAINLSEAELSAVVAFIHEQRARTARLQGNRRTVDDADLQTGDAAAGRRYFEGAGGCSKCHSPSGDLAGIANRLHGLALLQRMLNPRSGGGASRGRAPAQVTVTLASGQKITGRLEVRDEFTIALRDSAGWYRSWPTSEVSFTVEDPLDAHAAQLEKYTDDDMHNVLAYLQTLR